MKKIILSLLFLFIALNGYGEMLKVMGTVISSDDKDPFIGVNVNEKERPTNATATNLDGDFTISVEKGHTLVFSYANHVLKELVIENENPLNIELSADSIDVWVGDKPIEKPHNDTLKTSVILNGDIETGGIIVPFNYKYNGPIAGVIDNGYRFLVVDGYPLLNERFAPDVDLKSTESIYNEIQRLSPLIKPHVIDTVQVLDEPQIIVSRVIEVVTKKEYGVNTFLLNDKLTTRKEKIALGYLAYLSSAFISGGFHSPSNIKKIEKLWKIRDIRSIRIYPEGKEVLDKNKNRHTIYVEISGKRQN